MWLSAGLPIIACLIRMKLTVPRLSRSADSHYSPGHHSLFRALASQVVIDPKARITKIRGQWFQRQGIKIMATFHPAALLRNEGYKRPVWEDFKKICDEYHRL